MVSMRGGSLGQDLAFTAPHPSIDIHPPNTKPHPVSPLFSRSITQRVEVVADEAAKRTWLRQHLPTLVDAGEVLLFAGTKARVDELAAELAAQGVRAGAIHGDLDAGSRAAVLASFRAGTTHVLVATDVAARGLDIKTLKTVRRGVCGGGLLRPDSLL